VTDDDGNSGLGPRASGLGPSEPVPAPAPAPVPAPVPVPVPAPVPVPDPDALLPSEYSEADLRDAVGVAPRPEPRSTKRRAPSDDDRSRFDSDDDDSDDDAPARKWSRRTIVISAVSIIVGLSIAGLVFLGRANAERYVISCAADRVTAEQGRAFPPWGSHVLSGPEWKPIALPPNAECKPRETEDPFELETWYLGLLVDRASAALNARDLLDAIPAHVPSAAPTAPASPSPIDVAADQLNQALLLARAPERRDQRKAIEWLIGDVEYWRASLKVRNASAALLDAAKQFDTAAAKQAETTPPKRPGHPSDAPAWAALLHRLADDLHAGPSGAPLSSTSVPPAEPHVPAPAGVALPVEPTGSDTGSAAPPPTPDAGVPTGGVLL
jgi:hypothetical protein